MGDSFDTNDILQLKLIIDNLNNKIQNVNKYRKSQRDNNEKYNHCRFFPIFILMIHNKSPHIYNQ